MIAGVIQARMGSTRLPGKVLSDIAGESMLARVVERTAAMRFVDRVVVATTDQPADDAIAALADRQGWAVFRGSEADVLDRYVQAARQVGASHVVRVCSDCPLVAIGEADRVVARHLESGADYTHNLTVWDSGLPLGTGSEVFSAEALERSWREGTQPHHREHVDEYIYENPDSFHIELVPPPPGLVRPALRLTVDTPEDLDLVRQVYARVRPGSQLIDLYDVIALLDSEPALQSINEHVVQKRI